MLVIPTAEVSQFILGKTTYVYLGLPAISEIYKVGGNSLVRISDPKEIPSKVIEKLATGGTKASAAGMPEEVRKAQAELEKAASKAGLPPGYKWGVKDGKIVAVRIRASKK